MRLHLDQGTVQNEQIEVYAKIWHHHASRMHQSMILWLETSFNRLLAGLLLAVACTPTVLRPENPLRYTDFTLALQHPLLSKPGLESIRGSDH